MDYFLAEGQGSRELVRQLAQHQESKQLSKNF